MRKRENKQNHRPILRRFTTWLHGAGAKCALIYAVGTLVLLVLFAAACAPQRYSLSVGAISHQTITATKDVEDTVTTESRRREASVRVEATYHFQEGVTESVLSDLDETFRQLRIVQQYGLTLRVQDPAIMPLRPSGLRLMHIAAVGLFAAIAVPLGLLWLLVRFDPRIRSPQLIETRTRYPLLATIPAYPSPRERRRQFVRMAIGTSMVLAVVLLYGGIYAYKSNLG